MKKQIILIILLLLVMICFNSCSLLYYSTTHDISSPKYEGPIYSKWKAEQADILQRQINYANSAEFERLHSGGVINNTNGPDAKSIVDTNADPLNNVRNSSIVPTVPIQIEIRPIRY